MLEIKIRGNAEMQEGTSLMLKIPVKFWIFVLQHPHQRLLLPFFDVLALRYVMFEI